MRNHVQSFIFLILNNLDVSVLFESKGIIEKFLKEIELSLILHDGMIYSSKHV